MLRAQSSKTRLTSARQHTHTSQFAKQTTEQRKQRNDRTSTKKGGGGKVSKSNFRLLAQEHNASLAAQQTRVTSTTNTGSYPTLQKTTSLPDMLPIPQKVRHNWAVMGYLFGLVRQIDPDLKFVVDTFTLVGFLWFGKRFLQLALSLTSGLRVHFWSRFWTLDLKKKYGEWVMITGATDGIGLAYAREFARRGHSLILLGRNQTKLDNVKQDLAKLISADKIELICADLSTATPETYKDIANRLNGMDRDIGILFNNAGVMLPSPNRFLDQPESSILQHCSVNMAGVLMVTRCVLPGMCKRKRGLIINMSSLSAVMPMPSMGVYAASKKFVEFFSESLEYEYKSFGIEVQTLTPSYVATKMVNWSKALSSANVLTPSSETFAKSAVATLGRTNRTTGYWSHGIQQWISECLTPRWAWNLSSSLGLRALDTSRRSR